MKACYLFNPEHDLALANGDRHFIAPRNIREMARDLAPLMSIVEGNLLPWGWDLTAKAQFRQAGIPEEELPTDESLEALRHRSGRATAHHLLCTFLREHPADTYTGESLIVSSIDEIAAYAAQYGHILLKAPFSGSGKGLRHININVDDNVNLPSGRQSTSTLTSSLKKIESWATALIRRHGYLTAEPYYNKVQDFAMEFCVVDGQCHFIGYSLFVTDHHGRYGGNRLMSDTKIEELLATYIPREVLRETAYWLTIHHTDIVPDEWNTTRFPLYFGVDMMIVNAGQQSMANSGALGLFRNRQQDAGNFQLSTFNFQFTLHPCVEVNLRMNMGIIAHEVYRQCLSPETEGLYCIAIFADSASLRTFSTEQTALHPAKYSNGRLVRGYLPLTPVEGNTRYHAYVMCE